jgi:YidC/Oxa1 family membrane protein insertase
LPEFKNPNAAGGGSQDNRSFMVMLIVMIGVIFGVQYWRAQHNPQTESPNAPAAQSSTSQATAPGAPAAAAANTPATKQAAATPAVQAAAQTSTVVENELYRITFSNQGGQVTSWVLKNYKDADGKPLDLVHSGASAQFGYPLSLYTYDAGLTKALADALYVPSATGSLQAPATLTFKYSANGLDVTKTFSFGADYVVHADTIVLRNGAPVRALLAWPAALGDMANATAYASASIDLMQDGKDTHEAFKKISGGSTLNGPFDFAGVSDQYFGAVFMPDQPHSATAVELHNQIDVEKVQRKVGQGVGGKGTTVVPILGIASGDTSGRSQQRVFVGPKAVPVLKSIKTADGHSLEPLLDFGFWGPVGKYLFIGLQWVHKLITPAQGAGAAHDYSWGWAIIIFTILINLLLLPLRVTGMKSMLKMQRIQPQIDAIKAKYKNPKPTDPKMAEMNAEIMAFQKKEGVSMFGGCVPTLIQLPLLFAFFTMMTKVVELRMAHWFWLPDLSSADPYHILPIFMVVTSFLVQYYTPSPGVDPQQQKMMAFMMPAFSGYMTWNYASGLALYWNVGNLIMIAQQAVMNRTALGREIRELQAKRARRKAVVPGKAAPVRTIQGRR